MGQVQIVDPKRRYLPSLEGLRGYGFLLVFCGHYLLPWQLAHPNTVRLQLFTALSSLGLFAVPAFFVLSGYLIGGILFHTRNRKGYFRVFYSRRILRVFPVYYVTLLAISFSYWFVGFHPNGRFWLHFLYIQNILPGYLEHLGGPASMLHFWSLAVEEQFYILWPLVVWLFPSRRTLARVVTVLILVSWAARLGAPLFSMPLHDLLYFTPSRADAILFGVLIALVRDQAIFHRLTSYAKWVTLCGVLIVGSLAIGKGVAWSRTYWGVEIWIPLVNVTSAALVVAVIEEGSFLNRLCSFKWACWLGSLSYSLYVFHLTYQNFFNDYVFPHLCAYMRQSFAALTSGALAFCLTLLLSVLSYRLIEGPIINLKRHLRYGVAEEPTPIREATVVEPELVGTVS